MTLFSRALFRLTVLPRRLAIRSQTIPSTRFFTTLPSTREGLGLDAQYNILPLLETLEEAAKNIGQNYSLVLEIAKKMQSMLPASPNDAETKKILSQVYLCEYKALLHAYKHGPKESAPSVYSVRLALEKTMQLNPSYEIAQLWQEVPPEPEYSFRK